MNRSIKGGAVPCTIGDDAVLLLVVLLVFIVVFVVEIVVVGLSGADV